MSDALTDIARDDRRAKAYRGYFGRLYDYLQESSKENYKKLEEAAKETDAVPRGYWGSPTNLEKWLKERVKKLKQGDKIEWARILRRNIDYRVHEKLKAISPFANKVLINVDFGCGFVNIKLEGLESIVANLIAKHNFKAYDADDYLIALDIPEQAFKDGEVVWYGCGIYGINGPRDSEGKPKK